MNSVDHDGLHRVGLVMPVSHQLLRELLALDEPVRREIAHALLASLEPDAEDADGMSEAERATLDAAIARSIEELDAGKGIPLEQALSEIRARRAAAARAALPDEALVPARLVLEDLAFDRVVALLEHPPAPPPALRDLMRGPGR